ncbi:hypothetical protein F4782DRAFT_538900 [Xylaria castorea]|nr:hypothetical protein F4782DRAFT_538900 [Xylaria castorea]
MNLLRMSLIDNYCRIRSSPRKDDTTVECRWLVREWSVSPQFSLPPLPNIVAEWAAILPLVCHLADQRDDYITTGDVALLGRLSVGLFPRLGTLSGLARLLGRGTKYLDHASTRGGSSRTVWDAKWGSVFPCANGAAHSAVSKCLLSRGRSPLRRMPETMSPTPQSMDFTRPLERSGVTLKLVSDDPGRAVCNSNTGERSAKDEGIRRYQILHTYQLHRTQKRRSWKDQVDQLCFWLPGRIIWFFLLMSLAVLFALLGSYGSAALIVCTSVSQFVALSVTIRRPTAYLKNNETHDALHLYIGDRAIADTLLNKPMFILPEGRSVRLAACWFWFANLLQFAAMTFAAAQKGWDGLWMVVLLAGHWALRYSLYGRTIARDWLEREGIEAKVMSFEFSGRYAMVGAIQVFSASTTTQWMDDILVPHPRRGAWLKCMRGEKPTDEFGSHDARWLETTTEASFAAANVLKQVFSICNRSEASV